MKEIGRRRVPRFLVPPLHRAVRLVRPNIPSSPDLDISRFVVREHNLLVAPIPKVATRTLHHTFLRMNIDTNQCIQPLTADDISAMPPHVLSFTFVRNPWSRVFSCWYDKVHRGDRIATLKITSRFPGLKPFMSFESFVDWLGSEAGQDHYADRHWLSQSRFLLNSKDEICCSYLGKLERFDEDIQEISRRSSVEIPMIERKNFGKHTFKYDNMYNDRMKKIVGKRYEKDIDLFKYTFD